MVYAKVPRCWVVVLVLVGWCEAWGAETYYCDTRPESRRYCENDEFCQLINFSENGVHGVRYAEPAWDVHPRPMNASADDFLLIKSTDRFVLWRCGTRPNNRTEVTLECVRRPTVSYRYERQFYRVKVERGIGYRVDLPADSAGIYLTVVRTPYTVDGAFHHADANHFDAVQALGHFSVLTCRNTSVPFTVVVSEDCGSVPPPPTIRPTAATPKTSTEERRKKDPKRFEDRVLWPLLAGLSQLTLALVMLGLVLWCLKMLCRKPEETAATES